MASPALMCCTQVLDGGQVTTSSRPAAWERIACMLGRPGPARALPRACLIPQGAGRREVRPRGAPAVSRPGRVEALRVDVPGAGWP